MPLRLRGRQPAWVDDIGADRLTLSRLLVDAPGGVGKTSIASALAWREWVLFGRRSLILENRDKLVSQAADRLRKETGLEVDIEQADSHASPLAPIVVASIQTIGRINRLTGFADDHFGLVIPDECFPAGTLVDGKKIEDIRPGDTVVSYNHLKNRLEERKVLRLFKNPATSLVRVDIGGLSIICTPSHPFFTDHGYIPAKDLRGRQCALLKDNYFSMQALREGRDMSRPPSQLYESSGREGAPSLLLEGVRGWGMGNSQGDCCGEAWGVEQEVCVGANEAEQSDEQSSRCRKNEAVERGKNISVARREWNANEAADRTLGLPWQPADGICHTNRAGCSGISVTPPLLQSGSSCSGMEAGDRGRRGIASQQKMEILGRQKNNGLEFARVDRVEILESRGGPRCLQVCPDGFVYNFEVEGNNNYFVDGVLVHNCHHSLAAQYERTINYFHYGAESLVEEWVKPEDGTYVPKAHIVGLTATPDIGKKRNLGETYQKFSVRYSYLDAVEEGWLVPPIAERRPIPTANLRGLKTGRTPNGSDLRPEELSARLVPIVKELAKQIFDFAPNRKTIAFVPSVECARLLADSLAVMGFRAIFASGECLDVDEKTAEFAAAGPGTVLCNCALYVEGADFPDVDCVAWFRPTVSRAFFIQGVYRGTRVLPGLVSDSMTAEERREAIASSAKPNVLIIDPLWVTDDISLCSVHDLVTDKPEVKAKMLEFEGGDLIADAERAGRDWEKALEKAAKKHAKKQAQRIDPLKWALTIGEEQIAHYQPLTAADERPLTEGQTEYLDRNRIDRTNIKVFGHAQKVIGIHIQRFKAGRATMNQLEFMGKIGLGHMITPLLKQSEASHLINGFRASR